MYPLRFAVLVLMLFICVRSHAQFITNGIPQAVIDPDTIYVSMTECNDTTVVPITISNTGTGSLLYNIVFGEGVSDPFENGTSNWVLEGEWGLSNYAYSGGYSLAVSPIDYYGNNWLYAATYAEELQVFDMTNARLNFRLYHDMYCCGGGKSVESVYYCDQLIAQISVNGGDFQDVYSVECSNWEWQDIQVDLASFLSNGDRFVFRFLFSSDDYGTGSGVFIDNFEISGAGPAVPWLSLGNTGGLVLAGGSVQIPLVFKSEGVVSGHYTLELPIETTDTANPVWFIYLDFTLQGNPLLNTSATTLDFGDVQQNGTKTDTLIVQNDGCDSLLIFSISSDDSHFLPGGFPTVIPAYGQIALPVHFSPDTTGNFSAALSIVSNGGTQSMSLSGIGLPSPRLLIFPPAFLDTVNSCGDSAFVSLTLYNTGPVALDIALEPEIRSVSQQHCEPENYDYDCCGFGIYQVEFGTINHLSGSAADELNQDFTADFYTKLEAGSTYPLRIHTGTENYENVRVWIDYNNNGNFENEEVVFASVDNFSSIHEGLITIPEENVSLYTRLRMRVVSEYMYYTLPEACGPVYYGQYEDYSVVVTGLNQPALITSILLGDSLNVSFYAHTSGLSQGVHTFNLSVISNDPLNDTLIYPVSIWLEGTPQPGLSPVSIDFDTLAQNESATRMIDIFNTGCAPLIVPRPLALNGLTAQFYPEAEDTAVILPGDTLPLRLTFVSGIPGEHTVDLLLSMNGTDTTISVHAFVIPAAIPEFSPDSFQVVLENCTDSVSYPLYIDNSGLDTLEWYLAENVAGNALSFPGNSTQNFCIDSIGPLPVEGTVEFWFVQNYEHYWDNMGILSLSVNDFAYTGAGFDFRYYYDYLELIAGDSNGNYQNFTITSYIPKEQWNHVALSWDRNSDSLWLYYNGQLVLSVMAAYETTKNAALCLGRSGTSTNLFKGTLDEVRIWDVKRSSEQIRQFYNGSVAEGLPGLRAYFPMNEESGPLVNDYSTHGFHGAITDIDRVISDMPMERSASYSPDQGSIAPGDSAQVTISVNATGWTSGQHTLQIPVETNAPALPLFIHHLNVDLSGNPGIIAEPAVLDMDSIMVGLDTEKLITLINPGCEMLEITGLISTNPEFQVEEDTFNVMPFGEQDLYVYFNPLSAGLREDTLYFTSNAGQLAVPVSGKGLAAPDFVFSPDTLFLVSTDCGVPVQGSISLSNAGSVAAVYSVPADPGIFVEDFEDGLGNWETASSAWSPNGSGYQSNYSLNFYSAYTSVLFHTLDLKIPLQVIDPDSVYVSADILQNLACSWYGYDYLTFYVSRNGGDWEAKYSLTCTDYNFMHRTFQINDVSEGDVLRFRIGLRRYGYYSYTYGNIDNFTVSGVSQTPGFTVVSQTDTLHPGSTQQVNLSFTNSNLQLGRHFTMISVETSSPVQPVVQIPVVIDFQGQAHGQVQEDSIDFGYRMATSTTTIPVQVRNTGCDTLQLLSVSVQNPAFTAVFEPEAVFIQDSESFDIRFTPAVPGFYVDTLLIHTNAETLQVVLSGNAGQAPQLQVNPDSLLAEANCGDIVSVSLDLQNAGDTTLNWVLDPVTYDGLLVYYPFHPDVNDYSGNNRHLTDNGTLPARGLEDKDLTAREFFGSQFLQYSNESDIEANLFVPYATVSLWVKADSTYVDYYQKLFFLNYGLDIGIASGMISANASATNDEYFYLEAPFNYDAWVHVAVTFDGTSFILYLNGQAVDSESAAPCELEYYSYNKRLDIGSQSGYNLYYGVMDEVRFYNRSFSAEEIQALYASTLSHYLVFEVNPAQGSLAPGESVSSTISFNTSWLKEGSHTGFLYVQSNDPTHHFSGIPYRINVSGNPFPVLPAGCKDFGSVFIHETSTDSILLLNEGCDELVVTTLTTNTQDFIPESGPFSVAPFSSRWIRVSFMPVSAGSFTDTLHLATNAGILHHCLTGSSPGKPAIQVNAGLFTRILACTNTATDEVLVTNTGTQTLEVNLMQGAVLPWLSVPVTSLSLAPGQQGSIPLEFNRLGLGSGVYTTILSLQSNDPDYPLVGIQVHLLISNTYYTADLGKDTAFCAGTSHLLSPGYFSTYLWNTGAVTPSLLVTEPGIYAVSVSDISGCLSHDSIFVGVVNAPQVYAGSDTMACTGTSIALQAQVLNPLPFYPKTGIIGSGGVYYSGVDANPMSTAYTNRRTQYHYEAWELIQAGLNRGMINSVAFNLDNTDGIALNDYSVSIAFVTSYNPLNYNFINSVTQVYHANILNPVNGWNILQFDTSVYWDGVQSLIVQICHNNESAGTSPDYLYSYKYRGVITNYCYYCGDLCAESSYGWILHTRPVIQLGMEVDINEYTWEGPNGFFTHEPRPLIPYVENYYAGTYQLTIDNGYGCVGSDAVVLSVNPSPELDLGSDITILGWDSTSLQAVVSAAPDPYTYSWSPSEGLSDTLSQEVQVFTNQSQTYTVQVWSSNGCTDSDQIYVNVIPRYPLSGKLTYANVFQTPLPQSTIYRLNGEMVITDSASTDAYGDYAFPLLPVNTNNFSGTSELAPGGINATDALLVARHITGAQIMSGVRLQAADVNGSSTFSAADALLILHRTAGNISTFPAGDWTVEHRSVNHQSPSSVVNLTALSFGDVNGSFMPGIKAEPGVFLRSDDFVLAVDKSLVPVPVTLTSDLSLGALTLSVDYDPEWLTVKAVSSPLEGLVSNIGEQSIRLAWYDINGISLKQGDVVAVFWVIPKGNKDETETAFWLGEDAELADENARIYYDRELRIPRIRYEKEPQGLIYLGQNQPNPFTGSTTIPFSLPESGQVRFDIYSLLGERVVTGTEQPFNSGTHYWLLEGKDLSPGMYLYRFTFKGETLDYQQTRTLILNR